MPKIICVVGPTASGKTKCGVYLAKHFHGEVVSVDSMQIYKGMEIGTAAPTEQEMEGVPHHMIGVASPEENWSVARFVEQADICIQGILKIGKIPVLVGGTGLYLDALVKGNSFAPGDKGGELRKELQVRCEEEGLVSLYEELKEVDPEAAEHIHLNDEKRIIRALEVFYETGRSLSAHNKETQEQPNRYEALYIGLNYLDRQDLRDRIDKRVDEMVENGLLEEVRALLNSGLSRDSTALQAIGYKQFLKVLDKECSEKEAIEEVKLRSKQYAKRQLTWLRRNPDIFWINWEHNADFQKEMDSAVTYLKEVLQNEI